jgi:hypothetical protein
MLLYWRKGQLEFTTDVEDWMANQNFTEVFSYMGEPSDEEKAITRELDRILFKVRYGRQGIEDTLVKLAGSNAKMVSGRAKGKGQQNAAAAEGTAVDSVFKDYLEHALEGPLKRWKGVLTATPQGVRGADVIAPSLRVAWDVTTVGDVWNHVERDVFGKRPKGKPRIGKVWDRYYLLVWDEPRTNRMSKVKEIQAGRLK